MRLLPLTQGFSVQVHRSVMVSHFQLRLTKTTSAPIPAMLECLPLPSDANVVSPMYPRLKLIEQAIGLRKKANSSVKLTYHNYNKDNGRHLISDTIFKKRQRLCADDFLFTLSCKRFYNETLY